VVQGDTLGRLAERAGTTAQQLASANCLSNANVIAVGQPLRVPRQPNTAIPPTATPINAPVPLDLNPAGLPPGNVCAVSNPNPNAPVQVYVESGGGNLSPANIRLVTWAPFVRVMDAWYQIAAPETGGIFVPASQTILAGVTCPLNYQICTFTYPGSGNFLTYSGAGSNYGPGVQLPGNTPLPVLGRSQGWVQVGTDYLHAGWIESAAGTLAGPCN
jgi:hypothetical protein